MVLRYSLLYCTSAYQVVLAGCDVGLLAFFAFCDLLELPLTTDR